MSATLERLVIALGEKRVIELVKAGARANAATLTAAERRFLGVRA